LLGSLGAKEKKAPLQVFMTTPVLVMPVSHGTPSGSEGSEPYRIGIALLGELAPDHAD
jgi:hypothetical protein